MERFCFPGDTIGARGDAVDSIMTRVRNRWSKFRDLVLLLESRCLPLDVKGRLCSALVRSVMPYGT